MQNLTLFSDTAIITARAVVYPEVRHLMCRWHIDRYNTQDSVLSSIHTLLYRVSNTFHVERGEEKFTQQLATIDAHKAEIYKCLWMLMTEGATKIFKKIFSNPFNYGSPDSSPNTIRITNRKLQVLKMLHYDLDHLGTLPDCQEQRKPTWPC